MNEVLEELGRWITKSMILFNQNNHIRWFMICILVSSAWPSTQAVIDTHAAQYGNRNGVWPLPFPSTEFSPICFPVSYARLFVLFQIRHFQAETARRYSLGALPYSRSFHLSLSLCVNHDAVLGKQCLGSAGHRCVRGVCLWAQELLHVRWKGS